MKKLLVLLCLLVFISFIGCDNRNQTSYEYSNSTSNVSNRQATNDNPLRDKIVRHFNNLGFTFGKETINGYVTGGDALLAEQQNIQMLIKSHSGVVEYIDLTFWLAGKRAKDTNFSCFNDLANLIFPDDKEIQEIAKGGLGKIIQGRAGDKEEYNVKNAKITFGYLSTIDGECISCDIEFK